MSEQSPTGEMFVEVTFANGEMFRVLQSLEYYDDEYPPQFGEWDAPLPNERGNSFAFGLIEGMAQDDDYSGLFYRESIAPIAKVKTWKVEKGTT